MVPSPVRSLDHGLIIFFASSTWALILHCTNPHTKWEWTLLVLLLLVRALWRARRNSRAAPQCTTQGTVLPHLRLCQERSHLPLPASSPQSLEQLQGNEGSSGARKEQKILMGKQRRDIRTQKGLRRQRRSQTHKIRECWGWKGPLEIT